MTAVAPSDAVTIVEIDNVEISDEEMTHSYKIMYEKLVETVNENRELLKQTSQLCREKNELGKQVNVLKNEKEESLNELKQIKTTMWMMNSGTTKDQILVPRL